MISNQKGGLMRRVVRVFLAIFLLLGCLLAALWFYQPCMPTEEPVVAVLCGYNFFLKDNTTAKVYVERVLPYLRQCHNLQAIVVTGGVSRPTERPGQSEAGIMQRELLAHGVSVRIILEDRALSTRQNLLFSYELIVGDPKLRDARVIIFADVIKRPVIWFLLGGWNASCVGINLCSEYPKARQAKLRSGR